LTTCPLKWITPLLADAPALKVNTTTENNIPLTELPFIAGLRAAFHINKQR
jgi:hypothetical protein